MPTPMSPYLLVDINCTKCGRLMALSNAMRTENDYLCPRCALTLEEAIEKLREFKKESTDEKDDNCI